MCLQVHFHKGLIFFPLYPPSFSATHCGIRSHYCSKGFSGPHRFPYMATPHHMPRPLPLWGSRHRTRVLSGQGFRFIIPTAVKPFEDPCSVLLSLAPGAWSCDEELHPQLSERPSLSPTHQPHLSPKQSEQSPHLCPQSTRFVPPAEHLC